MTPSSELLFAEVVELGRKEQFFARIDDLARRVRVGGSVSRSVAFNRLKRRAA